MDQLIVFARRFKGFLAFAAFIFLGLIFLVGLLFSKGSFDQLLSGFNSLSPNQFLSIVYIVLGISFIIIILLIILSYRSTVKDSQQKIQSGLLYIIVHDIEDKTKGIEDAEVRLTLPEPRVSRTDSNGGAKFAFPAEFAGQLYLINASKAGYQNGKPQQAKMQHGNTINIGLKRSIQHKSQKAIDVNINTDFTVETLRDGEIIKDDDIPIKIEGKHSIKDQSSVWVVLEDDYGNFYLQNPPVMFQPNGYWRAVNVQLGRGVRIIHFIRVDTQGHLFFKQRVEKKRWDAFYDLPPESIILRSIHIVRE